MHLTRLAQFRALSRAQQRALFLAWACLPLVWLGLRVLGLARVQAWVLRHPPVTTPQARPPLSLSEIQELGEAVNIAARHSLFPATCLTRSLFLVWLLQRQHIASQLRIGVRLTQGALYAHAWVECEGLVVNDGADVGRRFAAFSEWLPAAAFD